MPDGKVFLPLYPSDASLCEMLQLLQKTLTFKTSAKPFL